MTFSVAITSLSYVSDAVRSINLNDLLAIQQESICNNSRLNITGILFHLEGQFVQVLEGEHDALLQLFVKIVQDDRHKNVRLLYHHPIDHRHFADWHMAMLDLELHSEAQKLDVKDLVFYAERLNSDPTAKQSINEILSRFQNLMLVGYDEDI